MPCGLLKLNSCGVGSSKLRPQSVQAKCDERTMSPGCVPRGAALLVGLVRVAASASSVVVIVDSAATGASARSDSSASLRRRDATMRLPLPMPSAVSTASASRPRTLGPAVEPVDDDFDVVPHLAVERQVVGELTRSCRRRGPARSPASAGPRTGRWYSPFWPRMTGASTANCVPAGSARMRAMICSRVWAVIGLPHCGQWPWPTRA